MVPLITYSRKLRKRDPRAGRTKRKRTWRRFLFWRRKPPQCPDCYSILNAKDILGGHTFGCLEFLDKEQPENDWSGHSHVLTADKLTVSFPEPDPRGIAFTGYREDGLRVLENDDPAHFNGYGDGSANLEDEPDNIRILDRTNGPGMYNMLTDSTRRMEQDAERSRRERGINNRLRLRLRPSLQQIREEFEVNNPHEPPQTPNRGTQTGTSVPYPQMVRQERDLNSFPPSLPLKVQSMRQVPQSLSRHGDEELVRAQIIVDNLLSRLWENRDPNFRRPLIPLLSFGPGDEKLLRARALVDNVLSKVRENLERYSSSE